MNNVKIFIPFSSTLNTGDAAILLSTINSIKRKFGRKSDITVGSRHAKTAKKYYPEIHFMKSSRSFNDFLFKKWIVRIPRDYFILFFQSIFGCIPIFLFSDYEIQMLKEIRKADFVLAPGGGYLTDSYYLAFKLVIFNFVIKQNKNLFLYSQSIGPIWKKTSLKFLEQILTKTKFIILRDNKSASNIKKIMGSVPENCVVSVDEAFTFCDLYDEKRDEKKKIGISVRDWNFSNTKETYKKSIQNYISNIKNICEFLIKEFDYEITFISTCQGENEYKDDSILALDIKASVEEKYRKSIIVNRDFHRPKQLIEIFREFDFFIGTRMHSIIFNFLNLTPCLGIVYEFKTKELFNRISLNEYLFDMYSEDYELFKKKIVSLIENRFEIRKILKKEIPRLQLMAKENIELIKNTYLDD